MDWIFLKFVLNEVKLQEYTMKSWLRRNKKLNPHFQQALGWELPLHFYEAIVETEILSLSLSLHLSLSSFIDFLELWFLWIGNNN